MVLCNENCIACCDFCAHAIHVMGEVNGKVVKLAPMGCNLHKDEEHQGYARSCYYCDDFHCLEAIKLEWLAHD